jgi:hypothetical protein
MADQAETSPSWKRAALRAAKIAWLALVIAGLWWFVSTYDLRSLLETQTLGTAALAVMLVMLAHAGVLLTQREAIRAHGADVTLPRNARIFNLTNLSKYVPLSGANLVVNAVLIRGLGLSNREAGTALLLLTYWTVLGAFVFGGVAAGMIIGLPWTWSAVLSLLGWAVALRIAPERWVGIRAQYSVWRVILGQALIWFGYGAAFALVLRLPGDGWTAMLTYGSAYDLSFGAGMLAVFAPSGIGVREAVTTLFIGNRDAADILAATIYLRGLILVADLLVFGMFWIRDRIARPAQ